MQNLKADREPCPVCGQPSGDCTGDNPVQLREIVGLDAFKSMKLEATFFVAEDVWEERWLTPFTKRKIRVAKGGTGIPFSLAIRLGLVSENPDNHNR